MEKRILVAPLNWGLGHATRCVPVINELQKQGATVFLGANGNAAHFLKAYYPRLEFIELPGYEVSYQRTGSFAWNFFKQLPQLQRSIQADRKLIAKVVNQFGIHGIISDNRYGVHHPNIPSILLSHQLAIQARGLQSLGAFGMQFFIHHFLNSFTSCWVPDYETAPGLAGKLSHPKSSSFKPTYVGPLSRFGEVVLPETNHVFDLIALLSGPEPQRSLFEKEIIEKAASFAGKIVLLRGLPGNNNIPPVPKNVKIFNHLADKDLVEYIAQSTNIICRSGYSSIMDLELLGRHAFLVPTPGQPEQEYLARLHGGSKGFTTVKQSTLNLNQIGFYKPEKLPNGSGHGGLIQAITQFLREV